MDCRGIRCFISADRIRGVIIESSKVEQRRKAVMGSYGGIVNGGSSYHKGIYREYNEAFTDSGGKCNTNY